MYINKRIGEIAWLCHVVGKTRLPAARKVYQWGMNDPIDQSFIYWTKGLGYMSQVQGRRLFGQKKKERIRMENKRFAMLLLASYCGCYYTLLPAGNMNR
ncbi:hypothetical protein CW304_01065 [Bacillus sp. UFRGS-B20]|nr:hypothetical protein CW304_01065 [Bacillus sp. UFRGS-B20]